MAKGAKALGEFEAASTSSPRPICPLIPEALSIITPSVLTTPPPHRPTTLPGLSVGTLDLFHGVDTDGNGAVTRGELGAAFKVSQAVDHLLTRSLGGVSARAGPMVCCW